MSNYKEFKKETINIKEVKGEELEKKEEKIIQNTSPARIKEDLKESEKMLEKINENEIEQIKKLKCDYKLFKDERNKNKMHVPANCETCNKKFQDNDNIYVALDKQLNQIFICVECAEEETKEQ